MKLTGEIGSWLRPCSGSVSQIVTSRSGAAYGSGRSTTESTTVNTVVAAPVPSPSTRTATSEKPGWSWNWRIAMRSAWLARLGGPRGELQVLEVLCYLLDRRVGQIDAGELGAPTHLPAPVAGRIGGGHVSSRWDARPRPPRARPGSGPSRPAATPAPAGPPR